MLTYNTATPQRRNNNNWRTHYEREDRTPDNSDHDNRSSKTTEKRDHIYLPRAANEWLTVVSAARVVTFLDNPCCTTVTWR